MYAYSEASFGSSRRFHEYTKSPAVTGRPSLQRAFARSRKVYVFPSGDTSHDSAAPGTGRIVFGSLRATPSKSS